MATIHGVTESWTHDWATSTSSLRIRCFVLASTAARTEVQAHQPGSLGVYVPQFPSPFSRLPLALFSFHTCILNVCRQHHILLHLYMGCFSYACHFRLNNSCLLSTHGVIHVKPSGTSHTSKDLLSSGTLLRCFSHLLIWAKIYVCFSNCIPSSFLKVGAVCFALWYLCLELEYISFWQTSSDDPETISGPFPGRPSLSLTPCKSKWSRSCQTDEFSQFILNSLLSVCCHIN